jgi:8-oxo-dGTP diphosphatase
MNYVCGFMFAKDKVLLIEKNRPAYLAGKWNGVGGKMEPGEEPIEAMVREFYEETGILTRPDEWEFALVKQGVGFTIFIFRSFVPTFPAYKTTTDEVVRDWPVESIGDAHFKGPKFGIPSLAENVWMVPMLQDRTVEFPIVIPFIGRS